MKWITWNEIKTDYCKRINEDEMFSFDTLDETKAKRKLHTYDKEAKAKRPHKHILSI